MLLSMNSARPARLPFGAPSALMTVIVAVGLLGGFEVFAQSAPPPSNFQRENLVAWCIVPFDSSRRGPGERAQMIRRLGMKRIAYDWREEHVASFEKEILAYKYYGIEYFAFWDVHPAAFDLFKKHGLHPQIWVTAPSPEAKNDQDRVKLSVERLMPVIEKANTIGSKVGLYNHGGWGGKPENLVAVCEALRAKTGSDTVGIVYNFHHAHDDLGNFEGSFELMQPLLLCANINGMNSNAHPKILTIGKGNHESDMIQAIIKSGYDGPVGIIDHRPEADSEEVLGENLDGLEAVLGAAR